jgi:hypothetical protein
MYRKDILNPADGLSRRPDYKEFAEKKNQTVLLTLLKNFQLWQARVNRSDLAKEPTVASIIIAIFTRKAAAGATLFVPFLLGDIEDASDTHAQRTETGSNAVSNLSEESLLKTIRNIAFTLPRSTARIAFQGTNGYEVPTDIIINLLLSLQINDNWNKGKIWESHFNLTVLSGQIKGEWLINNIGFVRKDGVAYVFRDVATINEIMRSNHNNPWQGGHFGRTRTQSLISKYY